jgi:hypothetical protein
MSRMVVVEIRRRFDIIRRADANRHWALVNPKLVNPKTLARSWLDSCPMPVVALHLDHRDSRPARPQRQPEGNRLPASCILLARSRAAHRGSDLYDINAQAALAAQCVPEAAGIRYLPLYPPQVSIFFAPLAHFSYGWALILWWTCSATCIRHLLLQPMARLPKPKRWPRHNCQLFWRVAFPAFFHMIAWGQTSAAALACFTGIFFLLRARREFLAGLVLGSLIFKPQLGLAAAILFASLGAWKIVAGAAHFGRRTTFRGSPLLRHAQPLRTLVATCCETCGPCLASARTQALSDSFLADFLVDAGPMASSCASHSMF